MAIAVRTAATSAPRRSDASPMCQVPSPSCGSAAPVGVMRVRIWLDSGLERAQQLVVNAAKAAVAHAQDVVAGPHRRLDLRDQLVDAVVHLGLAARPDAHSRQRFARIPVESAGMAKREVGVF